MRQIEKKKVITPRNRPPVENLSYAWAEGLEQTSERQAIRMLLHMIVGKYVYCILPLRIPVSRSWTKDPLARDGVADHANCRRYSAMTADFTSDTVARLEADSVHREEVRQMAISTPRDEKIIILRYSSMISKHPNWSSGITPACRPSYSTYL
ncbi:hypothetical protein L218DRAFT_950329 [Marasmius fiardii PR-910]|nr:hypothetical protein L218DRAFT_950329 [Marasmius fiardii PR-910]